MQKETSNILNEFAKRMEQVHNMHLPDIEGNIAEIKRMVANLDEEGLKEYADKLQSETNKVK